MDNNKYEFEIVDMKKLPKLSEQFKDPKNKNRIPVSKSDNA